MKNKIGKKILVTTSEWFRAPDGIVYKSVYGTLKAIHTTESTLGFTPSRTHTNWFIEIGNMTIAGCQVLYIVESEECNTGDVVDYTQEGIGTANGILNAQRFRRPSQIYNADL